MSKFLMALCVLMAGASMASAAIVYEPVQYQYRGPGGEAYYYGGRHPAAIARAVERNYALRYADVDYQPNTFIYRTDRTPAVYSDTALYMNLSIYGYTSVDAANEANASVPRYFRMADLMTVGHVDANGHLIIPANARPTMHVDIAAQPTTMPAPHAIIIIPKSAPKPKEAATKVANAR